MALSPPLAFGCLVVLLVMARCHTLRRRQACMDRQEGFDQQPQKPQGGGGGGDSAATKLLLDVDAQRSLRVQDTVRVRGPMHLFAGPPGTGPAMVALGVRERDRGGRGGGGGGGGTRVHHRIGGELRVGRTDVNGLDMRSGLRIPAGTNFHATTNVAGGGGGDHHPRLLVDVTPDAVEARAARIGPLDVVGDGTSTTMRMGSGELVMAADGGATVSGYDSVAIDGDFRVEGDDSARGARRRRHGFRTRRLRAMGDLTTEGDGGILVEGDGGVVASGGARFSGAVVAPALYGRDAATAASVHADAVTVHGDLLAGSRLDMGGPLCLRAPVPPELTSAAEPAAELACADERAMTAVARRGVARGDARDAVLRDDVSALVAGLSTAGGAAGGGVDPRVRSEAALLKQASDALREAVAAEGAAAVQVPGGVRTTGMLVDTAYVRVEDAGGGIATASRSTPPHRKLVLGTAQRATSDGSAASAGAVAVRDASGRAVLYVDMNAGSEGVAVPQLHADRLCAGDGVSCVTL